MRLKWAFRVSGYLTLALACACLGLATSQLIPGIRVFALPLLIVLTILCFLEERLALPIWAANLLGFTIALGAAVWIGARLFGHISDSGLADVPLPSALLPYLGPLLITLMLVKLLRPKTIVDHWVMQALGLILVALSCVLSTEAASGILLAAYLACGVWHLAIFHFYREALASPPEVGAPCTGPRIPLRGSMIRAVLWSGAALTIGLPLFLLLPRQGQSAWNPYQLFGGAKSAAARIAQTGFTNEIDLNSTGEVEVNDDVALIVQAQTAEGGPKPDLSAEQRWRGAVLDYYDNGRWITAAPQARRMPFGVGQAPPLEPQAVVQGTPPLAIGLMSEGSALPNLGPGQFYLTFTFQARTAGGMFLAEPVVLRPRNGQSIRSVIPVVSLQTDSPHAPLFHELRQTLQPGLNFGRGEYSYRQVTRQSEDPVQIEPVDHLLTSMSDLTAPVPEGLREWTEQLFQRPSLRAASGLTNSDFDSKGNVALGSEEKVAVALTEFFARSGEYTYTLNRRREDTSLDPTLDFLQNVKQGHCERFAGALALMLRSHRVHARVITGFRGAENKGDGTYVIRQNFAHSWVEALVLRDSHWHWRLLDPTPSTTAPPPSPFSWARWWERTRNKGAAAWKDLILNYEGEQQDALLHDTWDWFAKGGGTETTGVSGRSWRQLAAIAVATLAFVPAIWLAYCLWPRGRRREAERLSGVPFYNRMLALLARHARMRPQPAQTPREFADAARRWLCASQTTAPLAEIPARIAALLYQVRYGQRPLSEVEHRSAEEALQRLAAGLASTR
jgi:protein-glutamine gamma-glutamyltransferase